LFGCVQLPEPARCYLPFSPTTATTTSAGTTAAAGNTASSASSSSPSPPPQQQLPLYERNERSLLLSHLTDKNERRQPWATKLAAAFGTARPTLPPIPPLPPSPPPQTPTTTTAMSAGSTSEDSHHHQAEAEVEEAYEKLIALPPTLLGSPIVDHIQVFCLRPLSSLKTSKCCMFLYFLVCGVC
jgi:hypothetical protein